MATPRRVARACARASALTTARRGSYKAPNLKEQRRMPEVFRPVSGSSMRESKSSRAGSSRTSTARAPISGRPFASTPWSCCGTERRSARRPRCRRRVTTNASGTQPDRHRVAARHPVAARDAALPSGGPRSARRGAGAWASGAWWPHADPPVTSSSRELRPCTNQVRKEPESMAKPASAEQKAADRRRSAASSRPPSARSARGPRRRLGGLWSRRDVFGRFGWAIFGAFSGISLLAAAALGVSPRARSSRRRRSRRASRPTSPSAR